MQRRIEGADGDRESVHGAEDADKVRALHGQEFLEGLAAVLLVIGENHGAHVRNFLLAEKHVLGAAEADAFGAEGAGLDGVARNVGIGTDFHGAVRVRPAHEFLQLRIVGRRLQSIELALDDAAGGAVERDPVAGFEHLTFDAHFAGFFVHVDVAGTGHAALAHAARDHRGVTGHAAARGENALGDFHAVNIFRRGFGAHQDDGNLLAGPGFLDGFVGAEDDLTDGGAGRRGQTLGEHFDLLTLFVEARNQEVVQLIRLDPENGFFLLDQSFLHHLQGDANCRQPGTLAVAGLQHVELAVLDGELEVLHVFVMLFQPGGDVAELVVNRPA